MNKIIASLVQTTVRGEIIALLVASLFVIALVLGACAGPALVSTSVQPPTSAVQAGSVVFQFDALSIYPAQVYPGQQVVITAKVTNKSDIDGEYTSLLKINDTLEEQKKVALPAGATKVLNFSNSRHESGAYTVILGGLTGQFEVIPQTVPTQTGSGSAASSGGSSPPITPNTPTSPTTRKSCCGG